MEPKKDFEYIILTKETANINGQFVDFLNAIPYVYNEGMLKWETEKTEFLTDNSRTVYLDRKIKVAGIDEEAMKVLEKCGNFPYLIGFNMDDKLAIERKHYPYSMPLAKTKRDATGRFDYKLNKNGERYRVMFINFIDECEEFTFEPVRPSMK